MTLIVGAVTKDYVVINGDGRATSQSDAPIQKDDFIKVYLLANDVCFGVAANGISGYDVYMLTQEAPLAIDFSPPYELFDIASKFGEYVQDCFAYKPEVFSADIIFGGFSRDSENNPTDPKIFSLTTENSYIPKKKKGRQLYYTPSVGDVARNRHLRNNSDYLCRLLFGIINYVSSKEPGVGGTGTSVIIGRDETKWGRLELDE